MFDSQFVLDGHAVGSGIKTVGVPVTVNVVVEAIATDL
jgi:hypothetical protein